MLSQPTLITIALLILFMGRGCYDPGRDAEIRYPGGIDSYTDRRYYNFEPETVLTSLTQGVDKIFSPLSEQQAEQIEKDIFPTGSFTWQQHDYLKIAIPRPDLCGLELDPSSRSLFWNLENFAINSSCN